MFDFWKELPHSATCRISDQKNLETPQEELTNSSAAAFYFPLGCRKEEQMKQYDAECPVCGMINRHLFLEETDGWFECINCKSITKLAIEQKRPDINHYVRYRKPDNNAMVLRQ